MLKSFDWIRRSQSGTELLATLRCLAEDPDFASVAKEIGPPYSALVGPCKRCWIYPRVSDKDDYCQWCKKIRKRGQKLAPLSKNTALIWGFVNQLPPQLQQVQQLQKAGTGAGPYHGIHGIHGNEAGSKVNYIFGTYIHDTNSFLLAIASRKIKTWIQDIVIHQGPDLRGLLQIFPTTGSSKKTGMGDLLCRAVHHEANLPLDRLRVRFYSNPYQLVKPHERERKGILTFEVSEFLGLLEMAEVYRALIRPHEQKEIYEVLQIEETMERQFYWGRLLKRLDKAARDMLTAWNIRNWPQDRIGLLYELFDYVCSVT
jgi:hypothetical protein